MLGLGGFLLFGLSSLIGLLTGLVALRRARSKPLAYGGQRYAVAGIIVSSVSTVLLCGVAFYAFSAWRAEQQAKIQSLNNKATTQTSK
jgi:ABC-type antimicrobial peptide transport system permease subunit